MVSTPKQGLSLVEPLMMHIVVLVEFVENRVDDTHRRRMYNHREVVLRFASIILDDDWTMRFKLPSSNVMIVSVSSLLEDELTTMPVPAGYTTIPLRKSGWNIYSTSNCWIRQHTSSTIREDCIPYFNIFESQSNLVTDYILIYTNWILEYKCFS